MRNPGGTRPTEQSLADGDKWIEKKTPLQQWLFKVKLLAIHPFQPKHIPYVTHSSEEFNHICRNLAIEAIMYLGVGLAIIWVFFSGWLDLNSSPLRDFFQRSGAILIATSAAADFYVARDLKPFEEEEMMTLVAGSTLLKIRSLMKITGLAGLLVGTVVWAYGDFLFD